MTEKRREQEKCGTTRNFVGEVKEKMNCVEFVKQTKHILNRRNKECTAFRGDGFHISDLNITKKKT